VILTLILKLASEQQLLKLQLPDRKIHHPLKTKKIKSWLSCKISTTVLAFVKYSEDMDKEKKHAKKIKADYEEKIKGLNEKINNLQTNLENTKTDLSYLHK
jgi:hypothetical protein